MKSRAILAKHTSYRIHETESYKRALQKDYDYLEAKHGEAFADAWYENVQSHLDSLRAPGIEHANRLGTIDPKNYSKTYAYRHIPDTETTVFFNVEGDNIHLMTCGWSRANWPEIFKEKNAELAQSYDQSKAAAAHQPAAPKPQAPTTGGDLDDDPEARRQAEYRARAEAAEAKHDKAMDDKTQAPQPDQKPGQGQDIND